MAGGDVPQVLGNHLWASLLRAWWGSIRPAFPQAQSPSAHQRTYVGSPCNHQSIWNSIYKAQQDRFSVTLHHVTGKVNSFRCLSVVQANLIHSSWAVLCPLPLLSHMHNMKDQILTLKCGRDLVICEKQSWLKQYTSYVVVNICSLSPTWLDQEVGNERETIKLSLNQTLLDHLQVQGESSKIMSYRKQIS